MLTAFIDDSYTEQALIAEEPRVWPALNFSFRPMLPTEYGQWVDRAKRENEENAKHEMARRLATKIVEWDLRDAAGSPVEITAKNMTRLKLPLFLRLWEIVTCQTASDAPDAKKPDLESDLGNS